MSRSTDGGPALTSEKTEEKAQAIVEQLFLTHGAHLVALARTLSGGLDSGDDLVQDVFVRVLSACQRDPGYVREPSWPLLRQVLVRLAAQRRRSIARELRRLARLYERPDARVWDIDVDIVGALLTLPPRMRACVVLHYMEDLTVAEVAVAMNTRPGTVAAQIQTARRRLREQLAFDEHTPSAAAPRRNDR